MNFTNLYKKLLQETDYKGSHTSPSPDYGAPAHKLDDMFPDDVYGPNAARYYGHGDPSIDNNTVKLLHKLRDKPDEDVTIYRAVPKDVNDEINIGDWVTINKEYAEMHGERFDDGYKILQKTVKAKEIYTNADSIHEFGYHP